MFGSVVLALGALFFLFSSAGAGIAPAAFADRLGLNTADAGGRNEIRAQYGGFFLAVALICAGALVGAVAQQTALIVLVVLFGGVFAGRLAALALNGGAAGYGRAIVALHLVDAGGLALALAALVIDARG